MEDLGFLSWQRGCSEKFCLQTMEKCGCKGIRTCLLCEKKKGITERNPNEVELVSYTYCHHCDLCWPTNVPLHEELHCHPLVLNGICLLPEFVSSDEEADAITKIDLIPWVASQSGRNKQDFGPKVNFKKRKLKAGNFRGFPRFAQKIARKFKAVNVLSSFRPVELCHLEYCPERGSSIDPHLDDSWLWGERLVTLNLLSETTLILTPAKLETPANCNCCSVKRITNSAPCNNSCIVQLSKLNLCDGNADVQLGDANVQLGNADVKLSDDKSLHQVMNDCAVFNGIDNCSTNIDGDVQIGDGKNLFPVADTCASSTGIDRCNTSIDDSVHKGKTIRLTNVVTCAYHSHLHNTLLCQPFGNGIAIDSSSKRKTEVHLVLPRRSLLVLWGCARHHWYHEIRRNDIITRRLAMTFRELSSEFLEGGGQWPVGEEMLNVAQKIID